MVNANVNAIVTGSQEQSSGLKEINSAVNAMDQGTQKNAAMVEEATAASHGLAREAESLFQLVRQFNIGQPAARASHAGIVACRRFHTGPCGSASPRQLNKRLTDCRLRRQYRVEQLGWDEF